ncbi:MAG TPA: NAD(P)H-dependent oxidoreductase [Treponemataceae bacterium]|nr:NAD(P)H-dependent oxidoreductase [Spirochaetaceae bacterium]HOE08475.1 NAD(P)H-dependent oxidoreductase [Treponemataceae bacterium]HQL04867.1 NAD(P)H-dependent oxidoreductase [Treponemataceae bacterium]
MLIISASNVSASGEKSRSLQAAAKIKNRLSSPNRKIEIIDLRKYHLSFCVMCEKCLENQKCVQPDDFNTLFDTWNEHNQIILVVPHYALIPSKLLCMFEKIQERYYLNYCSGKQQDIPVKNVMIIAHGGLIKNYEEVYIKNIINPLKGIIESIGGKVDNDNLDSPLCFGVKEYLNKTDTDSVCYAKIDNVEKENEILEKVIGYYS